MADWRARHKKECVQASGGGAGGGVGVGAGGGVEVGASGDGQVGGGRSDTAILIDFLHSSEEGVPRFWGDITAR